MRVELSARWEINFERQRQVNLESDRLFGQSAGAKAGNLSRVVDDHYRCPEDFFDLFLSKPLSSDEGYFRFGPHTVCYGRTCSGVRGPRPDPSLYDAIGDVTVDDGKLGLPFDPTEIINNLRLERYAKTRGTNSSFENFLRRIYYFLRPFTNLAIRQQIQIFHARKWKNQPFPKWPVDTTVEDICKALLWMSMDARGVNSVPFVWFWPDGASSCMTMTHDVETRTGKDHCADLMDVDDAFGIKAAFGIVPEERYEVSTDLLELIRNRGFDVIIQDLNHDGRLYDNEEEFRRRAKLINHYCREYGAKGFRAAILYRNPEWYNAFEFSFDMSIPNVAHLDPQHGGCCTVMPYFIGEILELPVNTIQDYTLFHILGQHSIDLWKAQTELILEKHGLISFNVHPDYVIGHDTLAVYKSLLKYLQDLCQRTPIWCALSSQVDSWWRVRSKMCVVKDGHSWRIAGEGAERAVLAFAKIVDGNLVYELAESRTAC
jgi:hypothetical protein